MYSSLQALDYHLSLTLIKYTHTHTHSTHPLTVVRIVFRARTGTPGLYLLTPLLAPPRGDEAPGSRPQDCLVLNRLPFQDDFR